MEENLQIIIPLLTLVGLFFGLMCGYRIGRYQERKEWDKLIRDGKLPKPQNISAARRKEVE